jgi:hypothetical protein
MPYAKPATILGVAALVLCGCSSAAKPPQGRGKVDDPRTSATANHLKCIVNNGLPAQEVGGTGIQIGALPGGPSVQFLPSPGTAQGAQIEAQAQGAEVIGSALLFTHQASDGELQVIEGCLASGVNG